MVAMGHGLCVSFWVSGEMTKNKVGPKKVQCDLEISDTILQGSSRTKKKSQNKNFDDHITTI